MVNYANGPTSGEVHQYLYLARHFGPLQTRYTTWKTGPVSGLNRKEGGLALPNLRAEILALSAATVSYWSSLVAKEKMIIGDALLHNGRQKGGEPQKLTMGTTWRRVRGLMDEKKRFGQRGDMYWGNIREHDTR